MKRVNTRILVVLLLVTNLSCWSEETSSPAPVPASNAYSAQASPKGAGLKAAKKNSGASTHVTIKVDQPFTQGMADRAGLNAAQPGLSSDGLRSGDNLASSECLLAETLIAKSNEFSDKELDKFCGDAKSANTAEKVDAVKSSLEEHNDGTPIQDALIHIVSWKNGQADGAWYHYNRHAGGWTGKLVPFGSGDAVSSVDRLLGHGNVAFLAIHLGIDESCDISYDITAEHTTPLNQQDLADLIKLATDYYTKGTTAAGTGKTQNEAKKNGSLGIESVDPAKVEIGVWGGQTILKLPTLPASITLTPKTGKTAAAKPGATSEDSNTFQITTTCLNKESDQKKTEGEASSGAIASPAPVWRAKSVRWVPLGFRKAKSPAGGGSLQPADGKADPPASKDPLSNMGQSLVNEGIYWWDVSVALPVTNYKNLKFDSQNNLIVLKKSDDVKPYALFDFFPGGSDLRAKNGISMLGLYTGIPLSNQPLQKPFVGGGFTVAIKSFRFQPLAGIRIQKETRTSTLAPGSPGNSAQLTNDLHSEWHVKLQVMIGFSIGDARKVLGLK
jgi:hypothetical protein